jgi:hypothetical protein
MGNKQGKSKKPTQKTKEESETTASQSTSTDTGSENGNKVVPNSSTEGSDDIHPSWNDQVLFTRNGNDKKVTKDDFELLTVIGKGSFGKVVCFPRGI